MSEAAASQGVQVAGWNVTSRYALTGRLGEGAYGEVYKGEDRHNHNAPVAIKRILNVFRNKAHAVCILREIAILRRLDHPNIVKVVDVVIEPEPPASLRKRPFNVIYIVFEYGGIDLKKWMLSFQDASRPTPDAVRFVLKQMVAACGYLHRCSVLHRDIKPVNILIDPESLALRVADFGLSRVMQLTPEEEQQLASHHHPVRNFEPQLPPSSGNGHSALFHTNYPSESAAVAEFSSDDSDVECDAPSLVARQATKEVVTIWCAFHCFALMTYSYHPPCSACRVLILLLFEQVACSRGWSVQGAVQPSNRRVEPGLHIRGVASLHAARLRPVQRRPRPVSRQARRLSL